MVKSLNFTFINLQNPSKMLIFAPKVPMKYLFIIISLFTANLFAQDSVFYRTIYQGKMIEVKAEASLYQYKKSKNFFIHFTVKNISDNAIGIYTDSYLGLFYPNQIGTLDSAKREVVDEARVIPMLLNDSIINDLEEHYKNHRLTQLLPGEIFEYYRDFNGISKNKVKLPASRILFISVDGQLLVTNGSKVEHAHFDERSFSENATLYLRYPLIFKTIPVNSTVFYEH